MKPLLMMGVLTLAWPFALRAETIGFDDVAPGVTPPGWIAGVTGGGTHHWTVSADDTAPSKRNVLRQSAVGAFPWIVRQGVRLLDGFVEVKFEPQTGRDDQAAGVVWRFQDGGNYYVARANALEDNVSIYYVAGGSRRTILYVDAKSFGGEVSRNRWHTLRVEFRGRRHVVFLDGRKALEVDDDHIATAGSVGLWTKADSVTAFDDFSDGTSKP